MRGTEALVYWRDRCRQRSGMDRRASEKGAGVESQPQRLKPRSIRLADGTTKVVPFPTGRLAALGGRPKARSPHVSARLPACSAHQVQDGFEVVGLGEQIYQVCLFDAIACRLQRDQIAGQRRRDRRTHRSAGAQPDSPGRGRQRSPRPLRGGSITTRSGTTRRAPLVGLERFGRGTAPPSTAPPFH